MKTATSGKVTVDGISTSFGKLIRLGSYDKIARATGFRVDAGAEQRFQFTDITLTGAVAQPRIELD